MKNQSHSADVQMHLSINGHILKIGQLGPEFVILDDPTDHPPSEAEILMSVDGHETRWRVYLEDGISSGKSRTRITIPAGNP